MSFTRSHFIFISIIFQFLLGQMAFAQIKNFAEVDNGVSRSARPNSAEVQWLSDSNYTSILNLEAGMFSNSPGYVQDEAQQASELSLTFFHIPVSPLSGPTKEQIDEALSYISNPNNHPILVHCHYGQDRTGMVIAAYRMKYQGWSYEDAVAEMKSYGFKPALSSWIPLLKEYETK